MTDTFEGGLEVKQAGALRQASICLIAHKGSAAHPSLQQVRLVARDMMLVK